MRLRRTLGVLGMSFKEWTTIKLEEACIEITDGSHSSPKSVDDGYPMASVKDMRNVNIDLDSCRKISKNDYEKLVLANCKPKINDVLIAKDGSYLKHINVVKEEKELVLLSSIAILRPDTEVISPDFLKYFLSAPSVKNQLEQGYVSGSVIRRIVLKDFKRFPITLPRLTEQKAIANILSSLDEKIEVNNQINKKLEEMAQAIFKQWFVDFEFPNEEGKPYKSSGGEFKESSIGPIPSIWNSTKLESICEITSSKRIFQKDYVLEGVPFYRSKEIIEKSKGKMISTELFITDTLYDQIEKKYGVPQSGDILLTSVGTLGIPLLINDEKFYFKDGNLTWFKGFKHKYFNLFIYNWLLSKEGQDNLDQITIGSTQKALTIASLKKINIIEPSETCLQKFNSIVESIFNEKKVIESQNAKLIFIRNILLPKLMSGEIRVPLEKE